MTRGTTAQRDYGVAHQALRRAWAPRVALGIVACARCHELIPGGHIHDQTWQQSWHLDHTDDRRGYLGPSHARCNTTAPATKNADPRPTPRKAWR